VGARDNAPLPEDAVFVGGNTNRFAGRDEHIGEVGQKQAKTNNIGAGRETGQGAKSGQIC